MPSPHNQILKEEHSQTRANSQIKTQENEGLPKADTEMELLDADECCISGTAHFLIVGCNTTYVFKDIKTQKNKESKRKSGASKNGQDSIQMHFLT